MEDKSIAFESFPKRPLWRYSDSVEEVDARELAVLSAWLHHVDSIGEGHLVERNLEVIFYHLRGFTVYVGVEAVLESDGKE